MKKRTILSIIIGAVILLAFFIFITVHSFQKKEKEAYELGNIQIVTENQDMSNNLELEQNKIGDSGITDDTVPILICQITDTNNLLIGSDFLPLVGMLSYYDALTQYLMDYGYSGQINLTVIDDSVYKEDQLYYFSFQTEDDVSTIYCSFNEFNLQFYFSIY